MKKQTILLGLCVSAFLSLIAVPACYYDNEEDLYGVSSCDTVSVKYSAQIVQIMEANCYSCHKEGGSGYAGISLDQHVILKDYAADGSLLDRITTNDAIKLMPPGLPLPDCERQKIKAWIQAGAPNN